MSLSNNCDPGEADEDDCPRARAANDNAVVPDGDRALLTPAFLRLMAMQAAFGFSFSVFLLLPKVMAAEFGASASAIGLVMAAFGVASLLSIPLVGRAVKRFGHRGTLVAANLVMATGALGFVFVHDAGAAAALLRGLHGLAWSLAFAAGLSVAADLAPPARLAQAVGLVGAASLAMNALAPAVAEPLAESLGYRAIFGLGAVAALLGAALARRLRTPPPQGASAAAGSAAPRGSAAHRSGPYVVLGVGGLAFSVMFTYIAPFALQHGIRAVRGFFAAYTVAALAVRILAGPLADRLGHRRMAAGATVLYGVAVAAVGVVGPAPLVALGALFGAAHGALFPALMALVLADAPSWERPRALAVANGSMNLGVAAVFALGVLAGRWGYASAFLASGGVTVAAAALLVGRARGR